MDDDAEFSGEKLVDLVVAIEMVIGARRAGCTPLGRTVTALCEEAVARDRASSSDASKTRAAPTESTP